MSGGTFDYKQYTLNDIADQIERIVTRNNKIDDYGFKQEYKSETIKEFKNAVKILQKASIYVQRIDWLHAGDDGEDTFHSKLKKELMNPQ